MKRSHHFLRLFAVFTALTLTSGLQAQTVNFWFSLRGSQSTITDVDVTQGQTLDLSLWYQTDDSFPHNALEVLIGYDTTTLKGPLATPLDNQITLVGSPIVDTTLFDLIFANDTGGGYGPSTGVRPYGAHFVVSKLTGTVTANVPRKIADFTIRNQGVPGGGSYSITVYDAGNGTSWTSAIAQDTTVRRDETPASLNIHSISAPAISIADAKKVADSVYVSCTGKVVTAVFGNSFYIEEPDRTSGIRVTKPGFVVQDGDTVNVSGLMGRDAASGERVIDASSGTVAVVGN